MLRTAFTPHRNIPSSAHSTSQRRFHPGRSRISDLVTMDLGALIMQRPIRSVFRPHDPTKQVPQRPAGLPPPGVHVERSRRDISVRSADPQSQTASHRDAVQHVQRPIRTAVMRGGSSKGLFLHAADLPPPGPERDAVVLRLYGSPDPRQIDGLGGADVLTSKVAIIGDASVPDADLDYTFGQVDIFNRRVDYGGNCGNISAGVGPFAVDEGLLPLEEGCTGASVRIHNTNTGALLRASFPIEWLATPASRRPAAQVEGPCSIAGVPGSGAAVELDFSRTAGSVTGRLLPSGRRREVLQVPPGAGGAAAGVEVTLLDAGQPTVFVRAEALGLCRDQGPPQWAAQLQQTELGAGSLVERLRGAAAVKMGIVNSWEEAVETSAYTPFVVAIGAPKEHSRDLDAVCVFMQQVHKAYPVTGAVATTAAALMPGTLVHECTAAAEGEPQRTLRICHPSQVMEVEGAVEDGDSGPLLTRAVIKRTARRLMDGHAYIPWSVWPKE